MRYVYPKVGKKALMLLIDAKSNGKTGSMELSEPLYIYDSFGEYTDEIKRIFHAKRS
jgi:tRNA1(Val) A37 N6-methylase TrmN6